MKNKFREVEKGTDSKQKILQNNNNKTEIKLQLIQKKIHKSSEWVFYLNRWSCLCSVCVIHMLCDVLVRPSSI